MKKNLYFIALLAIACVLPVTAQKVTGFSDLKVFLDPGHYGVYNQGYGGYSEAEKVLIVAHDVKDFLVTYTDMKPENIQLSRLLDSDGDITLSNRVAAARTLGANFLLSIHSDAPSTTAYSSLLLYGGRRLVQNGPIVEKTVEGGKQFGDIHVNDLTSVLRAIRSNGDVRPDNSRGNLGDWGFYYSDGRTGGPYLGMNNHTVCASLLSEAGFHTNPAQNMQFINREHKRMQAYSAYQSLVKYLSEKHLGGRINPVQIGIATGFVFDNETMAPINGAKITITGDGAEKTYTTDTWASLPKKYTFTQEEFGNGFYWIEGFTPGATVNIKVEATGFETQETTLTIPTTIGATTIDGLGVMDLRLLNEMPAKVKNIVTKHDLSGKVIQRYPMDVVFDRKMNKATVEAAVSFSPEGTVTYSWPNDFTLRIDITQLEFETAYTLTIDGSIAKNSVTDDFLDGNSDGTPGGIFTRNFTTCDSDTDPPVIVSYDPQGIQEESARPIVRIEFDEFLNELSFSHTPITVTDANGNAIDGVFSYHTTTNFKSAIHYIFNEDLKPQEKYTVTLAAGIEDMYGNAIPEDFTFEFTAKPRVVTPVKTLADFNNALGSNWWDVTGSGSTQGVITTPPPPATRAVGDSQVKPVVDAAGSVRVDYLWDKTHGNPLIRWHYNASDISVSKDVIQYYLFGDGSKSRVTVALRAASGGDFYAHQFQVLDWVGWRQITWDIANDPYFWPLLGGSSAIPASVILSCFFIYPAESVADRIYEQSSIYFSRLRLVKLGDFIPGNVGMGKITAEGIDVSAQSDYIDISADTAINDVKVYSITGALVKSAQPGQTSYHVPTGNLAKGIYVVRVTTGSSQKNVKVVVK